MVIYLKVQLKKFKYLEETLAHPFQFRLLQLRTAISGLAQARKKLSQFVSLTTSDLRQLDYRILNTIKSNQAIFSISSIHPWRHCS